jgi:TrmH family RNA methyltransferase
LQGAIVFAFGNEGGGLSKELASMAHLSIAIPMAKGIESLNVAASVAVCLFEWWRQNNMS